METVTSTQPARKPRSLVPVDAPEPGDTDAARIAAFGNALDALRREVELQLGPEDALHIQRIGKLSARLELAGRGLIYVSLEPLSFALGTAMLSAHKALELMEIGHMALHGAYDGLPESKRFQSESFYWKAPIDEAHWREGHNVRHHQYTGIAGKDPDLDFSVLRLSPRLVHRGMHALQPLTNIFTWFGFTTAINLHVTGMLEYLRRADQPAMHDRDPAAVRSGQRAFLSKAARYYGKEYGLYPLLAGPFFAKVLLANMLSELTRDLFAGAIIYCGHVGASDFPEDATPETRAHWYAMQVEASRHIEVPLPLSILCGALDHQIEHHLFPRLPPNRLRQIAPRVRAICEQYGVKYRSDSWPKTLRSVFSELRRLSARNATVAN